MADEKRLIDVDAFLEFWNKEYRHQYANDMFKVAIANFPTVDAVEVVRCKDCRYYGCCVRDDFCEVHEAYMNPNDFCSRGERIMSDDLS